MSTRNIQAGDFLHKLGIYDPDKSDDLDQITKVHEYYQILDISDTNIDVIFNQGLPLPTTTVFELDEIEKDYSITVINDVDVKSECVYDGYTYKNLERQELIGFKYSWNDKTVTIPIPRVYYSGNGVWREFPNELKDIRKYNLQHQEDGTPVWKLIPEN